MASLVPGPVEDPITASSSPLGELREHEALSSSSTKALNHHIDCNTSVNNDKSRTSEGSSEACFERSDLQHKTTDEKSSTNISTQAINHQNNSTEEPSLVSSGDELEMKFGLGTTNESETVNSPDIATVPTGDDVELEADGDAETEADGDAEIEAKDDVKIEAKHDVEVEAGDNVETEAGHDAEIEADGDAEIEADGNAKLEARDDVETEAGHDAKIEADGNATLEADGAVETEADGNAEIEAGDNVETEAGHDAEIEADGNAKLEADGDVETEADGNAKLEARDDVETEAGHDAEIEARDDVKLKAGHDVEIEARDDVETEAGHDAEIEVRDDVKLEAGHDVEIEARDDVETEAGHDTEMEAGDNVEIKAISLPVADASDAIEAVISVSNGVSSSVSLSFSGEHRENENKEPPGSQVIETDCDKVESDGTLSNRQALSTGQCGLGDHPTPIESAEKEVLSASAPDEGKDISHKSSVLDEGPVSPVSNALDAPKTETAQVITGGGGLINEDDVSISTEPVSGDAGTPVDVAGDKAENATEMEGEVKDKPAEPLNVLGNDKLIKLVLSKGEGITSRPVQGNMVTVRVRSELVLPHPSLPVPVDSRTPAITSIEETFRLGDGDVIIAIDLGVSLMELGEVCELVAAPDYAYKTLGKEPDVPSNSWLCLTMQLIQVNPSPNFASLPFEECLEFGTKKKDRGNYLFQRKEFEGAIISYQRGVDVLMGVANDEVHDVKMCVLKDLHNNQAAAHLKIGDYQAAIISCDRALKVDSHNIKALFRKGKTLSMLGEYTRAEEVLSMGLTFDPESKLIQQELARITKILQKEAAQEKALYKKMISGRTSEQGTPGSSPTEPVRRRGEHSHLLGNDEHPPANTPNGAQQGGTWDALKSYLGVAGICAVFIGTGIAVCKYCT